MNDNSNSNSNNNSASPDGVGCGGLLPITEQNTSPTTTTSSSSSLLWDEVAAILSGLIGGGKYGLKIRVPHAVVMTFLFGNNLSFRNKLKVIAKLAAEHSINLASFACLYKFLLASLKTLSRLLIADEDHRGNNSYDVHHSGVIIIIRRFIKYCISMVINGPPLFPTSNNNISNNTLPGLPEHPYHAFLAGAIGGYCIWGKYSSVNYQLVLYLTSRIIVGCIKLAREKGLPPFSWKRLTFHNSYPYGAALIWGTVMMLFEEYPNVLHPSLRRSMDEIYRFGSFGSSSTDSSP